jgi:hypothetical protein
MKISLVFSIYSGPQGTKFYNQSPVQLGPCEQVLQSRGQTSQVLGSGSPGRLNPAAPVGVATPSYLSTLEEGISEVCPSGAKMADQVCQPLYLTLFLLCRCDRLGSMSTGRATYLR